jgi:hypothetical protein
MPRAATLGLLFVLSHAAAPAASAAPVAVDFRDARWTHGDPSARVVRHLDREALYLRRGGSHLRGVAMEDGIVEVYVAPEGPASFAGIAFRVRGGGNAEEVYARLSLAGNPQALQYTPRFNGSEGWQLYRGPGYTAAADLTRGGGWTHLKIVVEGPEARVYVNGAARPSLMVTDLKHEPGEGSVGVWAASGAYFSGFRYTPLPRGVVPREQRRAAPAGTLARWEVSQAFEAGAVPADRYPSAELAARLRWDRVGAEPDGLVNLSRFRGKARVDNDPGLNSEDVVFARTTLRAERAGVRRLALGYSDRVAVFLNGRPVFAGNSAYQSRHAGFLGIVGPENDAVYLDLREGDNELVLAVADRMGGWGFIARLDEEERAASPERSPAPRLTTSRRKGGPTATAPRR